MTMCNLHLYKVDFREKVKISICTPIPTAASLTIAQRWKPPTCPSVMNGDVIRPHKGVLSNLNKEGSPAPAATGMSPEDAMPREITSHRRTNARLFHLHEVPPLPKHVSQRDAGTPPLMHTCPRDKSGEEVACCGSCSKTGGPGSPGCPVVRTQVLSLPGAGFSLGSDGN